MIKGWYYQGPDPRAEHGTPFNPPEWGGVVYEINDKINSYLFYYPGGFGPTVGVAWGDVNYQLLYSIFSMSCVFL